MDYIYALIVTFFGLCLGSFATALVYRLPRDISMLTKARSSCPSCRHTLGFPDLVPVFSYLFLKGRCRHCRAAIGPRYLLIEFATLALCLAVFFCFGFSVELLPVYLLMPALVSIVAIDLQHKIIPDALNAAVLIFGFFSPLTVDWMDALGGALAFGLFSYLLRAVFMWRMKREPMGMGDVKFFAAAGMWIGIYNIESAVHFLFLSGFFGIILALLWKKIKGEPDFPFGPALVSALTVILFSYGWSL